MPSTNYAYVNGRFVPEEQATVSIFDCGFLYGDGVFETMRVYQGKIFRLYEHLQRLSNGLKLLQMGSRLVQEELRATLLQLLERNDVKDGMTRIYVTRGSSVLGLKTQGADQPTVIAIAKQRTTLAMMLRAVVISSIRLDAASKLTGIKSANRLLYVMAKQEADHGGFDDAVLLNGAGHVVELTTSNLFVVKGGELFTPPLVDGPLPGITRDLVLTLASKLGIPAYESSFGTDMFAEADEVFATNSLVEIEPVAEVDGARFDGHHVIMRLRDAYRDLVREELGLP
jgi:branched-chain amino acid aminotransferase